MVPRAMRSIVRRRAAMAALLTIPPFVMAGLVPAIYVFLT